MEQLTSKTNKEFSRKKYYLIYSGIFLFCSTLFILYLVLNGKTNINFKSDGMNQHYRALVYYSRYLKEIVRNLFVNHKLVIPLWDFSIGEGADVINVLHSDAVGDPLTFLSVLVPEKFLPAYYMFNAFIRVYLAGVFFSELCFYLKNRNMHSVLAGTLVYIFCYWSIQSLTFHIYFLTPFMYLPLLILGVEKIIENDKPYLFIVAVFLASISWLYFFYMEAMATAIYGVTRVAFKYKTDIKAIIGKLLNVLVHAILGIMMAMIVLMPMIMAYMGDSRMGVAGSAPKLYPWFFYERLFTIFVANDYPYDLCLGFVSPTLLAIVVLLKNYKKHSLLLLLNILCAIFLIFPIFGKIWNGFAYVSQRWAFVVALPIAYNMVVAWDEFKNNKKLLLVSLPIIFCAAFFSAWARNERVIVPIIICFVFCFVSVFDNKGSIIKPRLRQTIMLGLLLVNIFYIFEYNLSPRGGDFISDLLSIEEANNLTSNSEAYAIKKYTKDEEGFSRYTGNYLTNNASILYDVYSTNFYWSITNPNDQKFRMDLGLKDRLSWQLIGYDDRAELETLANVKYYVKVDEYAGAIPYGFEYADTVDGYKIYKNQFCLPFGYTYNHSISYQEFEKLNMVEKQEIMMQSIVVDSPQLESMNTNYSTNVLYSVENEDGIAINDKTVVVSDYNATLRLNFDNVSNNGIYVLFEGLEFNNTKEEIEDDVSITWLVLNASNGSNSNIAYLPKEHRYHFGKKNYVCYLENNSSGINHIDLSFSVPGTYSFDNISVIYEDMKDYDKYIKNLSDSYLRNIIFDVNTLSGDIELEQDKYLLLSVPFSNGWKAKVDGKEAELIRANVHYCGLFLEQGSHHIELCYCTPGLKHGAIISFFSFLIFFIYIFKDRIYMKISKTK